MRRRELLTSLVSMPAALAAAKCGYKRVDTGETLSPKIATIAVPTFANRTTGYRIEQRLAEAVRQELIRRTRFTVNSQESADVVVTGESQEADGTFDNPEYVLDAAAGGLPKGWIVLGHAVSEEQGMLEMAQWIKSFTPEIPVQLVKAEEPFWVPE